MKGVIRQKRKLGPDGEWVYTQHYFLDGREVTEAEFAVEFPSDPGLPAAFASWRRPIHSLSQGYHPDQIPEAREHLKKLGVPTDIDAGGNPVLTSHSHKAKFQKALKLIDRNSYTGH